MDPKTPLKTVFNVQIGIDRYAYLLRLESVVRQRLNKLLVGGKAHLGWEYGATHTTIRVFTSSKRYTKETEDTLNYHIHHFLGVRAEVVKSSAVPVVKVRRAAQRSVSSTSSASASRASSSSSSLASSTSSKSSLSETPETSASAGAGLSRPSSPTSSIPSTSISDRRSDYIRPVPAVSA